MSESLPRIPERTPLRVAMTFFGSLLAFLIFGVAIWVIVRSYSNQPTVEDERSKVRLDYKAEAETMARRYLETYGWVDKEKGLAHVPVAEAAKRVIEAYQTKQVKASAVPVPGTAAAGALLGSGGAGGATGAGGNGTTAADSAASVNPEALIPASDAVGDTSTDGVPVSNADKGAPPESRDNPVQESSQP